VAILYSDIELWSKEAPLACRNFIQLALEGYYDNTIVHRIVKGFMVQMGDPTGTGTGQRSPHLFACFRNDLTYLGSFEANQIVVCHCFTS